MDFQRQTNGLVTFVEHWGLLLAVAFVFLALQVFSFFANLNGGRWIWCYAISLSIAAVGATLIFYAKLPLYQQRRFFTFGSRALREDRRPFYRWGYGCVIVAAAMLFCLFLSRP